MSDGYWPFGLIRVPDIHCLHTEFEVVLEKRKPPHASSKDAEVQPFERDVRYLVMPIVIVGCVVHGLRMYSSSARDRHPIGVGLWDSSP